jgi:predicted Zn-dependent peptidase
VQDILKQRSNSKQNKRTILSGGLANYAKYGAHSLFTDIISEKELRKINPQELVDIVKIFNSYQHGFFYYGPTEKAQISTLLKQLKTPENLKEVPQRVEYAELPMDKPMVYFANYDMVQAEIMLIAKDKVFDPALMPLQTMFNAYYGGGMNSIIFQEIREARGLAYSAYAYTSNATRAGLSNYVNAYIGTQADKMTAAMDVLYQLLREMPMSENAFQKSKEFVINNLRTSRTTKSDIFWTYMWCKDHHIDYDYNETVYKVIDRMTLADVQNYFNQHIKPAQFTVLIVGSKDRIDFKYLKKIAKIKEIPLKKLFGY